MSNCTLKHMCFLVLLSLSVGQGHGIWKPSKDSLKKDIEVYRKMAIRIKQELKEYYDEYAENLFDDYNYENNNDEKSNIYVAGRKYSDFAQNNINLSDNFSLKQNKLKDSYHQNLTHKTPYEEKLNNKNILYLTKKWPKFEDMLLAIGKKYDWKNDRWIKVKHKDKTFSKGVNDKNNDAHHQKHNFIYKIVKLNNAKSKRNVIAVTAVR